MHVNDVKVLGNFDRIRKGIKLWHKVCDTLNGDEFGTQLNLYLSKRNNESCMWCSVLDMEGSVSQGLA